MKHDSQDLETLLDDVLPDDCGPDRAALLGMVREARACRRRLRLAAVSGVAVLLMLALFAWHPPSQAPAPMATAPPIPAPARAMMIQEVDDRQFLALLQDAPVALMEWPSGERTLLVVRR
jgi:hypothetical protein